MAKNTSQESHQRSIALTLSDRQVIQEPYESTQQT